MDSLEERIDQLQKENRTLKRELAKRTGGDEDLENGESGQDQGDEQVFQ